MPLPLSVHTRAPNGESAVHVQNTFLFLPVPLFSNILVHGLATLNICNTMYIAPMPQVIQFQAFVMCLLVARVFQRIFFGKLRDQEREDLYDRSWFAVTETCLAMTIFRDEFTPKIFGLFGLLLAVKAFHWLAQLRVEW